MRQNKAILAVLFVLLMCTIPANAVPVIDFSSPAQFAKLTHGTSQTYTVTANESIDTWAWSVDGVDQATNSDSISIVLSTRGQHNVTVTATNVNGIATYSFYPYSLRQTTTEDSVRIENSGYSEIMDSFRTYEINDFFGAVTIPGTMMLGGFYYLFVIGLPFYMIWNRQQKLLLPSVLGLILGFIMIPLIPEQYTMFAQLSIVLGATGVVWAVYKDR